MLFVLPGPSQESLVLRNFLKPPDPWVTPSSVPSPRCKHRVSTPLLACSSPGLHCGPRLMMAGPCFTSKTAPVSLANDMGTLHRCLGHEIQNHGRTLAQQPPPVAQHTCRMQSHPPVPAAAALPQASPAIQGLPPHSHPCSTSSCQFSTQQWPASSYVVRSCHLSASTFKPLPRPLAVGAAPPNHAVYHLGLMLLITVLPCVFLPT